jgi:ribonuclease BN (tRNA processing enzyme)
MKLTVLGSGSTVPHPRRASSAYWLETSDGTILLDCSASVGSRMAAAGLVGQTGRDWISHFTSTTSADCALSPEQTRRTNESESR